MARQWLVRVPLNFAVGPGAVHEEFMEGCVILENGAEQAKIRVELAILVGTKNVERLGGKGSRAQGGGCALGRREKYYGFDPVVARDIAGYVNFEVRPVLRRMN